MENLINKISSSRQEMINSNGPKYIELMENQYSTMLGNLREILIEERKKYNSNIDFYKNVAFQFANMYIPRLITDYGNLLSDDTKKILMNIASGNGLKVFNPGEAIEQGYISINKNGKPNGDDGAFAKSELGVIGFTPESETSKIDFSKLDAEELCNRFPILKDYDLSSMSQEKIGEMITIDNAIKMLTVMIHETFHLVIDVAKEEQFYYRENNEIKHKLTSGGFILNEGLVDKFAIDFAKRHGLYHMPSFFYMDYVNLCDAIEERLGSDAFNEAVFHCSYDEILSKALTPEELMLYKFNERKKYFEKRGINYTDIIMQQTDFLSQESNKVR